MLEQDNLLSAIEEQKGQFEEKEVPQTYELVISGMGPAALTVAYMAAFRGRKVLLVGDRSPDFVRVQGVRIDPFNSKTLLSWLRKELEEKKALIPDLVLHPEDLKFVEEMKMNSALALKDIERFLVRRLAYLNHKNPGLVNYLHHAQFVEADLETGQARVELSKPEKTSLSLHFNYFIGADGPKHHAANIIQDGERKSLIQYEQRYHSEGHAFAYFTVKGAQPELPEKNFLVDYEKNQLAVLSYNKRAADQGKLKCSLSAELPRALLPQDRNQPSLEEEEKIKQYLEARARKILNAQSKELDFEIENSKKHGKAKDKIKSTVFSVSVHRANQAAICGKHSHRLFALVGETFQGANYQAGHGLNDALYCAIKLGFSKGLLDSCSQENLEEYNQYCLHWGRVAAVRTATLSRVKQISSRYSFLAALLQRIIKKNIEDDVAHMGADTEQELFLIEKLLKNSPERLKEARPLDLELEAYLASAKKEVEEWKKKSESLLKRKQEISSGRADHLYKKMTYYLENLEQNLRYAKELDLDWELKDFQAKNIKALEQAEHVLGRQRRLNAFFQNLGLCVSTGIIPYGFFWGRKYFQTGKHLICNETDSMKKLKRIKKTIKNVPDSDPASASVAAAVFKI